MMLVEQTTVPSAALPVAELKDHLRLGTGFGDDGVQDSVLENYLRSAIAAVEARVGKTLVTKQYTWSLTSWRDNAQQPLPLAPVQTVDELRIVDRLGLAATVDASTYRLEQDAQRPRLWSMGGNLPNIPMGGSAEIDLTAGYGAAWSDVPVDLALATFMLVGQSFL